MSLSGLIPADLSLFAAVALAVVALIAATARGFSGFGAALIFMPLASSFATPRLVAPLLLVIDFVSMAPTVPAAWHEADRRATAVIVAGALVGVPLGTWFLTRLDPVTVRWIITGFVVALLALLISGWRYRGKDYAALSVAVGAVSGFCSGVAQTGGPPIVGYWLGRPIAPKVARANIVLFFGASDCFAMVSYAASGLITWDSLKLSLLIGPVYALGVALGASLFGRASEQMFRVICYALIAIAVIAGLPALDGVLGRGQPHRNETNREDAMINRRTMLSLAMGTAAAMATRSVIAQGARTGTRIVFLGTKGGPRVGIGASNPANLVVVNGTPFVIDCGMGVSRQLVNAGVPIPSVKYILISHHHSDHNLEYGNLVYNAWAAGLSTPIQSFGPKGLEAMTRSFWETNKFDVDTRIGDEGRPDPRPLLIAKDIDADGVVVKTADVTVTAFRTPHPPITDNFAYKFETPDGTIVFSSDTAYNPKLAEFARGADVLVHECLYVPAVDRLVIKTKNGATLKKHLLESHTTTEDVGRIAAAAGVKALVLSHFVPGDDPEVTDEDWTRDVKKNYSGRIVVAKDLMELKLPVQALSKQNGGR